MHKDRFELSFTIKGEKHKASVDVMDRGSHLQYTIFPCDKTLEIKYGTQVFHAFPEQPLAPAFPGTSAEMRQYSDAVKDALQSAIGWHVL